MILERSVLFAVGLLGAALLGASALHHRVKLLSRFFIPPALTAGAVLLFSGPEAAAWIPRDVHSLYSSWPAFLVSFLFAGVVLGEERSESPVSTALSVTRQGIFVWFVALSQIAIGFAVVFLIPGAPVLFGHVIEIGWAGGPGSAAAMTAVTERLGDRTAGDLSVISATIGLVWGTVSGIGIVNILRRKHGSKDSTPNLDFDSQKFEISPSVILQGLAALSVTVLAARLALDAVGRVAGFVSADAARLVDDLPLFFVSLLAAFGLRPFLRRVDPHGRLSHAVRILSGVVLDVLVVAAVASIRLSSLKAHSGIFLLLMAAAALWSIVLFFVFSPMLLPAKHKWELGLLNFGMATGTTALGLMLLRAYRSPETRTSASIYGLAAPLSAPWIGGGALSLYLPILTAEGHASGVFLFAVAGSVLALGLGVLLRLWAARKQPTPPGLFAKNR